jgi:D-alanyl-D-alanine carboxypeptidase
MQNTEIICAWKTKNGISSTSNELVAWWSITKTILAVACLRLYEENRVDLDTLLQGKQFTLRQLLNHSSGVPNYSSLAEYESSVELSKPAWQDALLLTKAKSDVLRFQSGHGWEYSNTGYLLVRKLIEEVTESEIQIAIHDLVFKPLGISSAFIARSKNDLTDCKWLSNTGYDPRWVYHGLAIGSAADAVKFLYKVLSTGFLSATTLSSMKESIELGGEIDGRPMLTCAYGLGLMTGKMKNLGQSYGHSGAGPYSVAALYNFPEIKNPITACAFGSSLDEAHAEWEVVKIAKQFQ